MDAEAGARPLVRRAPLALVAAVAVTAGIAAYTWLTFPPPFVSAAHIARQLGLLLVLLGAFRGWGELLCRALGVTRARLIARTAAGAAATATVVGYLAPWWFPDALFTTPWLLVGWLLWLPRWLQHRRATALETANASGTPVAGSVPEVGVAPPLSTSPIASAASEASTASADSALPTATGAAAWLPWLPSLFFLQLPLVIALAPPVGLDSLVYHLGIPRQAALYGRLLPMPWLTFSSFPLHAEMLYGVTLALDGGGVLAQLLQLAAAVAAVVIAARLAGRAFGAAAAPFAALLLASAPVLNLTAGMAGSDWLVIFYVALALEQHARAGDEPAARRLEAVFLGAAAATKYTALPALVLFLVPWRRLPWRRLFVQGALVLAVTLPWYGRNLLLHHNPLYPFLGGSPAGAALSHARGDVSLLARLGHYLFEPQLIDESVGLLLPAAAVIAAWMLPGRRRAPRALLVVALVYALVLLATHATVRSFGPLLLAVAVLGGGGMALLAATPRRRLALWTLVLAVLPLHLVNVLVSWELDDNRPLRALAGFESADDYLRRTQPYLDAYRAVGRYAPPNARVLVMGESRVFYLDRPAIYGSAVDPSPFGPFAGSPPDAATAARRLRDAGVRFVVSYPAQLRVGPRPPGIRWELNHHLTPELDRAFRQLLVKHARVVWHRDNFWIHELTTRDARGAAAATTPPGRGGAS